MAKYRCFFVNAADRFDGVETVEAATDTDALIYAKRLLQKERCTKAVEIWNQGELIGRIDRERA